MIFFVTLAVLFLLSSYVKYLYSYWDRKGFPSEKPRIPFGSLTPIIRIKTTMGELMRDIHLKHTEPYVGIYYLMRPALLIRDPALVKRILISDFEHFHDRGVHYDEQVDPVGANLFGMRGQKWKDLRNKLSPTFTSGKLKNMFQPIEEKTLLFREHLLNLTDTETEIHLKTHLIRLNLSIIASVFFGFELNAFEDPDHEFNQIGDVFMDPHLLRNKFAFTTYFLSPSLMNFLKFPYLSPTVSKYVLNLITSVIKARTEDPSLVRKDFIQTAMEWMENAKEEERITIEMCAAQAFLFYIAGYETNAATASFCIYELCRYPTWMEKAQTEVDALMKKRNGKILYEDLAELKVVDMCIKETMRKFPAAPMLNRICTIDYPIPGTDKVIPKGTPILISNFGLHMDPEHFPNPEIFDPGRFEAENTRDDLPYYPVRK